jgi:hypothetical protein
VTILEECVNAHCEPGDVPGLEKTRISRSNPMKRSLLLLGSLALVAFALGCDETTLNGLPSEMQAVVSSFKLDMVSQPGQFGDQDRQQDQDRLRLMDGSCDGDGNQYQYGGSNGSGGNGGGGSGGNGDQLQLRDRSCGG